MEKFFQLYSHFDEVEKKAHKEKKRLKSRILEFGDGGNFEAYGWKCSCEERISLDLKKMEKDGIDLEKYKKKSSFHWKIMAPYIKKTHSKNSPLV